MLGAADPAPPASGTGESAPTGVVWYRLQDPGATAAAGSELEWYVRADHLQPGRAYRVDLTVDGHSIYSVGNGRADGTGRVTAHGLLARFTDQYCVSTPTLPQRLTGPHQIAFAVKSDGAGSGSASAGSPLTDPARELPCDGNGDGIFAYWLVTRTPASIGGPRP